MEPKLRFYQTYDEKGLDSEVTLQYWDTDYECWENVPFVRERLTNYCNEEDD